jgi:hypothetical protein
MGLLYLYLYFDGVQPNNAPITSSGTSIGDNVWLEQIKQLHNFEERNTTHWSPKLMDFHYVTEHPSGKKIPHVYVLSRHIAVVMTSLLVWTGCVIGTEIGSVLASAQTIWIPQL